MKKSQHLRLQCLAALCWLALCTQLSAQAPDPAASAAAQAEAPQQETQNDTTRPVVDSHQQHLMLLAEELDSSALQWLETSEGKFLAVWEANKSGEPFGAVLLLHGNGESTESPHTMKALRDNLSQHGWATLAVSLPPMAGPTIPPRAPPTAADGKTSAPQEGQVKQQSAATSGPKTGAMNPEKSSDERMRAAMAFLYEQGQYNIVAVGIGLGALRAARFIDSLGMGAEGNSATKPEGSSASNRPIRALIMIGALNQIPTGGGKISDYFNDPSLPVLDIYSDEQYPDSLLIDQRRRLAREKQIKEYFQVKVLRPTTSDESSENRLTRRVRGFLSQHAKGVAIERKRDG